MSDLLDRLKLHYHYLRKTGRLLNLRNPRYFTEKVQLAKLTWRHPRMVQFADKIAAKRLVAEILGPEWVTPSLYAGPDLPPHGERVWPAPYVIKSNHRSGANHFVRDPAGADWPAIEQKVRRWRDGVYGARLHEWVYTQIPRHILVEPFIGSGKAPMDYKIYVFGGRVAFTLVVWDRFSGAKRVTFDGDWQRMPAMSNDFDNYAGNDLPPRPACYDEMVRGAEALARGFPFVRVDLYEVEGRPRFGELTFYPLSGLFPMLEKYDLYAGSLWPPGLPDPQAWSGAGSRI